MAYLISTKSQGKRYFYLAQYTGKRPYTKKKYIHIYNFGNENRAFERMSLWLMDNNFIPNELIKIGISIDDIENWRKKVENTIKRYSL
ncbi:hypothetical protein [Bacillus wiedmannii]|uniref:hypothetical protein n=1 Tax=Bacillus wiedmannii TaxID=1890302 RepID=UPI003D202D1D